MIKVHLRAGRLEGPILNELDSVGLNQLDRLDIYNKINFKIRCPAHIKRNIYSNISNEVG